MKKLTRDMVCYAMSAGNAPQLHVNPGETFALETEDCYSGNLRTSEDCFTKEMWDTVNPATGPVYINGAAPGDVLGIDIESITTRDYAVMCLEHGSGALGDHIEGIETTIHPVADGLLKISDVLSAPVRTMIGVLGVAPAGEAVLNGTPGGHGSNMDCNEITAGSSVYLPIAVEGALLAAGDLHAVMGDGEVCICGAEIAGEIVLSTRVLGNCALPTPCVETADSIMFLGSAETLDECEQIVLDMAHGFLTGLAGVGANEAARIMSLLGSLGVCQVVDPLKTMKFVLPKYVVKTCRRADRLGDVFKSL